MARKPLSNPFDHIFGGQDVVSRWDEAEQVEWSVPNCPHPRVVPVAPLKTWPDDPRLAVKDLKGYMVVECGRCDQCNRRRWLQVGARIANEATWYHNQGYEYSFLSLTYNDESLPRDSAGNVVLYRRDFENFMKLFRANIANMNVRLDGKLRYAACGEYGEEKGRPHWHVMALGFPPCEYGETRRSVMASGADCCWQCRLVQRSWPHGYVQSKVVQSVGRASRYLVKYMLKDIRHVVDPMFSMSRGMGHRLCVDVASGFREWLAERYVRDVSAHGVDFALARQSTFRESFREGLLSSKIIPYGGRGYLRQMMAIAGETVTESEARLHKALIISQKNEMRRHKSRMTAAEVFEASHLVKNLSLAKREKIRGQKK